MNKNILYISYDGITDPLGQSQILPYISELSRKGLKFHLISFEKSIGSLIKTAMKKFVKTI